MKGEDAQNVGLRRMIAEEMDRKLESVNQSDIDTNLQELISLTHPGFPRSAESAQSNLEEIESGANIVNLLELLFKDRKVEKNVVLCGGQVPASLVIDDLYVVQIHENVAVHYRKGDDERLRKMARAR